MPYKQWVDFEKLLAADVNTYLADQSVMVFADSSARSTAISSPTEGMVTYLTGTNSLELYNGSSWVAVSAGAATGQYMADLDPANAASIALSQTPSAGTWYQASAGLGSNVVIWGMDGITSDFEIGTGAAASEVCRWAGQGRDPISFRYGVYVPASTRIAFRRPVGTGAIAGRLHYATVSSGTQVEAGGDSTGVSVGTSWTEIASTPPKAGGVWVVACGSRAASTIQFGLGPAASEVAVTAAITTTTATQGTYEFPPFFWPSSTRLACRLSGGTATIRTYWRETLDD